MNLKNSILIFDGNYIVHRAWHAYKDLCTSEHVPTGILYGFFKTLFSLCVQKKYVIPPEDIYVVWDHKDKARTQRMREFIATIDYDDPILKNFKSFEYKGHRTKDISDEQKQQYRESFYPQLNILQKIIPQLGIKTFRIRGIEGDDLIGVLSHTLLNNTQKPIVIVSSDHDLYQLLNEHIALYILNKNTLFTSDDFSKQYKITPSQWPDVRALSGDPSDGIPGVPGIGLKKALKLIQTYTTVDNVIQAAHTEQSATWSKIKAHARQIQFAKHMSIIITDPTHFDKNDYEAFQQQYNHQPTIYSDEFYKFCEQYQTFSLKKPFHIWIANNTTTHIQNEFVSIDTTITTRSKGSEQDQRAQTLEELTAVWHTCQRCPRAQYRTKPIIYSGNPKASILLCGEFPHISEDLHHKLFAGNLGAALEKQLHPLGFRKTDLHITTLVACRGEENISPTRYEIQECFPRLQQQIRIVNPKIIVLMGDKVTQAFFPGWKGKGQIQKQHPVFPHIKFFAIYPIYYTEQLTNHSHKIKNYYTWQLIKEELFRA